MMALRLVLVLLIVIAGGVPVSAVSAQQAREAKRLEPVWVDLSMGPAYVDWFNQNARTGDIARIDHLVLTGLLDEIDTSRRLVVFKSIREAEETMPLIAGQIDIIGYNIEHGPANPEEEKLAPVDSVFHMRELADSYGVTLAVGPDHDFAVNNGTEMAKYADIMILQVQRVQTDPAQVREFVLPLARAMREVNPEIEISMQIGANGNASELAQLVRSMAQELDGVSILTDHESTEFITDFIRELRGEYSPAIGQSDLYTVTYLVVTALLLNMSIAAAIHTQTAIQYEQESVP